MDNDDDDYDDDAAAGHGDDDDDELHLFAKRYLALTGSYRLKI